MAQNASAPEASPATTLVDIRERYDIADLEEKGRGAFSRVVVGTCKKTGEKRAVKIMEKAGLVGKKAEMVAHEKEVLRRTNHPAIIKLHECIETPTRVYMVMELMETDLFEYIVKAKKLSEADAALVIRSMLEAVSYLHAHSVVHRDIKPENILVNAATETTPLKVKLADFGLAKVVQEWDVKSTPCGTSFYIAPEIIRGIEQNGARPLVTNREEVKFVDMWSIGVVLYILLAGRPPFTGQVKTGTDRRNLLTKIDRGVLFPDTHWASVSETAKDLVSKLLTQDTTARLTADKALRHPFVSEKQSVAPLETPSLMAGRRREEFGNDVDAVQKALLEAGDEEGEKTAYNQQQAPAPAARKVEMRPFPFPKKSPPVPAKPAE